MLFDGIAGIDRKRDTGDVPAGLPAQIDHCFGHVDGFDQRNGQQVFQCLLPSGYSAIRCATASLRSMGVATPHG